MCLESKMGGKSTKEASPSGADKERQYRTEYRAYNSPNYGPKAKPRSPSLDDFKPFSKIDRSSPFRPPGAGPGKRAPPLPSEQLLLYSNTAFARYGSSFMPRLRGPSLSRSKNSRVRKHLYCCHHRPMLSWTCFA